MVIKNKRVFCPLASCFGIMIKSPVKKHDKDIVYKCSNCKTLAVIKRDLIED